MKCGSAHFIDKTAELQYYRISSGGYMETAKHSYKNQGSMQVVLDAFFKICELWGLQEEEKRILLGSPPKRTYFSWKQNRDGNLPHDTLERISYILGIFQALQILLPNPKVADNWVKHSNDAPLFKGQSALDRMLSGHVADLYVVRQYLDAQRGGWA